MKHWFAALLLLCFLPLAVWAQESEEALSQKVETLLKKMTLEEKVGQMTQVTLEVISAQKGTVSAPHKMDPARLHKAVVDYNVGSILNVYDKALTLEEWHRLITAIQEVATQKTRLKIPVIYGIDAIHGANYTHEATLFPQAVAMAATRNTELMRHSGEITAREVRASGIPWNFNPVLGVGRQPLWPRLFETFGEDPYLVSQMGAAYIRGLQGEAGQLGDPERVAACMKHYLGYSVPLSGKDRTPAWIPERMMREIFLPPFKAAVDAGVATVMINSGEINGIPVHSDSYLLTEVLRNELGFQGFVVSDWADVNRLYDRDGVADSRREAVRMAVMAGVDMSMVPLDYSFYEDLLSLARAGEVPLSRIDEAVARILRVKMQLGLFENPYPDPALKKKVATGEAIAASLKAAQQSVTLLKNDRNVLPLAKKQRVLLTGPAANLRSPLNSGWSYTWQGNEEALYPTDHPTILQAIQQKIGDANLTYVPGSTFDAPLDIAAAAAAAGKADVAIICIGEAAYCETPGNIDDLTLPAAQLQLVKAVQQTGTPVVLVLVEGRPRIITSIADNTPAMLMAYLPGPQGGQAIADVIFGDVNPSGKLPFTYPRNTNDLVCYDYKPLSMDESNKMNPLFWFGHGLSYTSFKYSGLAASKTEYQENEEIRISVAVKNSGKRRGREVVELYLRDMVRSVSPPVRQLKRFTAVELEPGAAEKVEFTLTMEDLAFYNRENRRAVEGGEYMVLIGDQETTFRLVLESGKAQLQQTR